MSFYDDDPYGFARLRDLAERQDRLEAAEQAREGETVQEQVAGAVAEVDRQLDALGVPEQHKDWILSRALAMDPGADGLPDIDRAYNEAHDIGLMNDYVEPDPVPELPLYASDNERTLWMTERLAEDERAELELAREEGVEDRPWVAEMRAPNLDNEQERHRAMAEQLDYLNQQEG